MYNNISYAIINNERWNNMVQVYRKTINRNRKQNIRNLKYKIKKRYAFITIILIILFIIIIFRLFYLQVLKEEQYNKEYVSEQITV